MQISPSAEWNPAETDGLSEDWLERLQRVSAEHRVIKTPVGALFGRLAEVERLLTHPALRVPIIEQYQRLGVSGPILERLERVILGLDGAEHTRLRKLVDEAFTRRAVGRLSDQMAAFLKSRLDAADGAVDFLSDIIGDYPAAIIGGLLGLPPSDLQRLTTIAQTITGAQFSMNIQRAQEYLSAAADCDAYLGELVRSKRSRPGDDILTHLTQAEVDGDRLSDAEIVSLCSSLMVAGIDTTRNQAALGISLFCSYPAQWKLLVADPGLAGNAVEEVLRVRAGDPVAEPHQYRTRRSRWHGTGAGTYVSLAVAVVNRTNESIRAIRPRST